MFLKLTFLQLFVHIGQLRQLSNGVFVVYSRPISLVWNLNIFCITSFSKLAISIHITQHEHMHKFTLYYIRIFMMHTFLSVQLFYKWPRRYALMSFYFHIVHMRARYSSLNDIFIALSGFRLNAEMTMCIWTICSYITFLYVLFLYETSNFFYLRVGFPGIRIRCRKPNTEWIAVIYMILLLGKLVLTHTMENTYYCICI